MLQHPPYPSHRPSLVRYTIRDLLQVMLWSSIALALIAAIAQRLPEISRQEFLLGVSVSTSVIGLGVATTLIERWKAEYHAGASIYLFPAEGATNRWWQKPLAGGATVLACVPTVLAVMDAGVSGLAHSWMFLWVVFSVARNMAFSLWERRGSLELCDQGLIFHGRHFIGTESVCDCYWGTALPGRLFILSRQGLLYELDFELRERSMISRALAERVPTFRPEAPQST